MKRFIDNCPILLSYLSTIMGAVQNANYETLILLN